MANKAMKSPEWKAKKAKRDAEGVIAWREYLQNQQSIGERIAEQRAQRLAKRGPLSQIRTTGGTP